MTILEPMRAEAIEAPGRTVTASAVDVRRTRTRTRATTTSTSTSTSTSRTTRDWLPVGLATAAVAWGGNQFTPLLVMYRLDRGLSLVTVDLMLAAYVVGIVPALMIGGPLSDRFGRRKLFAPAPFVAMFASVLLALGASAPALIFLGRIVSGVAIGLAMAVGTSWIKELSSAPWDHDADEGVGARRASLSLTVGFLFGAGVAGALAQWAPAPEVLPYLVHVVLTLPVAIVLRRAPDVPRPVLTRIRLRDQLRVPSVRNVRFRRVVAPSAPWVFGCAGVAYAVLPGLASAHVGGLRIAFSALATVVTLGAGVLVQPFARHLDRVGSSRAITVGLLLTAIGMALAAVAAGSLAVPLVLLAACVLGCAYGINLVSGLLEVQRIAEPGDLAGLTAVYYALSYVGFAVPAAMSLLVVHVSYPVMLGVGAVIAAASRWSVVRAQSSR